MKKKIFFFSVIILIFFVFFEISSRIILKVKHISINDKMFRYVNPLKLYNDEKEYLLIPHPFLPFYPRAGYKSKNIYINSYSLKNKEINIDKPDTVIRIICLGGSTTWNGYVDMQHTYPALLEKKLNNYFKNKINKHFEVINAGVTNYTSLDSLVNFVIRLIYLKPDIVTFYHAVNDVPFYKFSDKEFKYDYFHLYKDMEYERSIFFDYIPDFFENSAFYLIFRRLYLKDFSPQRLSSYISFKTNVYRKSVKKNFNFNMMNKVYRQNLITLSKICKGYGIKLILSTFHYDGKKRVELDYLNGIIREIAKKEKLQLVDNYLLLKKYKNLHVFDKIHWNGKGTEKMAENFYKKIKKIYERNK